MAISVGSKAPDFKLKDKNGKVYSLASLKAKHIVLYFYPKDDTSGCTLEAKGFNKQLADFKKLGATVIGISGGDEKSKATFCKKYGLNLPLLSDTNFAVSKKWNSYGTKSFMGRKYTGVLRKTFVLDSSLKIVKIYDSVKPETHSAEVLKFLKAWSASPTVATKKSTIKKTPTKTAAARTITKKIVVTKIAKKAAGKKVIAKKVIAKKVILATKATPAKAARKASPRKSVAKVKTAARKRTTARR